MAIDINTDGFLSYKSDWMIFLVFFLLYVLNFMHAIKLLLLVNLLFFLVLRDPSIVMLLICLGNVHDYFEYTCTFKLFNLLKITQNCENQHSNISKAIKIHIT